jgi:hypothetical protein
MVREKLPTPMPNPGSPILMNESNLAPGGPGLYSVRVRCSSEAAALLHRSEPPLCANSGLMQRNKQGLQSSTSVAVEAPPGNMKAKHPKGRYSVLPYFLPHQGLDAHLSIANKRRRTCRIN